MRVGRLRRLRFGASFPEGSEGEDDEADAGEDQRDPDDDAEDRDPVAM
jgi:hypothetical protein